MQDKLDWLIARAKIHDVFMAYASSVDARDWARLQTVFTEDLDRDMSDFSGQPAEKIKSAQHVSECEATLPGFDTTQHFMVNNEIVVDGDSATAKVYVTADHTLADEDVQKQFTINGFYQFGFSRVGDDWKISTLTFNVLSTRGDQAVFAIAAERAAA